MDPPAAGGATTPLDASPTATEHLQRSAPEQAAPRETATTSMATEEPASMHKTQQPIEDSAAPAGTSPAGTPASPEMALPAPDAASAGLAAGTQEPDAAPAPAAAPPPAVAAVDAPLESAPPPTASLEQQLKDRDKVIHRLSRQLQHYRSWVTSVHLRVQHMNPKAIQNAKRLYIGNLPPNVTEEELCVFLNQLMSQTGAQVGSDPAVLQCHITPERNFAFAEFRSVEEASNAMGLDGVAWRDAYLKVRRPSNYDLATSLMLGPITPDPTMDVSCLQLFKPVPDESPNKLFVGGLPCEWPEQAVRLILEPWGTIKAFNLVMDKATGNSKGYAFCEFVDESVTDSAIAGLNGQRAGTKTLTVKRAVEGARPNTQSCTAGSMQPSMSGSMAGNSLLGGSSGMGGGHGGMTVGSPVPTPGGSCDDGMHRGGGSVNNSGHGMTAFAAAMGGGNGGFGRKSTGILAPGSGGPLPAAQGMGAPAAPAGCMLAGQQMVAAAAIAAGMGGGRGAPLQVGYGGGVGMPLSMPAPVDMHMPAVMQQAMGMQTAYMPHYPTGAVMMAAAPGAMMPAFPHASVEHMMAVGSPAPVAGSRSQQPFAPGVGMGGGKSGPGSSGAAGGGGGQRGGLAMMGTGGMVQGGSPTAVQGTWQQQQQQQQPPQQPGLPGLVQGAMRMPGSMPRGPE